MEIKLATFAVEVAMPHFLLKAKFQPRGDLLIYLNDQAVKYYGFMEVKMSPLGGDYQVRPFRQSIMTVNEKFLAFISLVKAEEVEKLQLLRSKRPVVFYTDWFAIRGNLHVNEDARGDDLLDGPRDYFAVSDASVYPIRKAEAHPSRKVPLLLFNRNAVYAYHPHQTDAGTEV
ncbi:MAG: hypothetical protein ACE5FD_05445 [Anaerolineae bacterium]